MIWLTFAGHFGVTTDKDQPKYLCTIYLWNWIIFHGFKGLLFFGQYPTKQAIFWRGCVSECSQDRWAINFLPKRSSIFRTSGQTSTMDRVFLAFERYVNFSIVALGNAACNWGRVSWIFEFSVEKVEMDFLRENKYLRFFQQNHEQILQKLDTFLENKIL